MASRAKTHKQKPLACACVDTYNISVFFRLNESSWNPSSWNGRHPSDGLLTFFVVLDFCHMPQSLWADIVLVWPDQPAWLPFSLFSRLVSRCWLLCHGVRLMPGRKATTNRNKYEKRKDILHNRLNLTEKPNWPFRIISIYLMQADIYYTSTSLVQGDREVSKKQPATSICLFLHLRRCTYYGKNVNSRNIDELKKFLFVFFICANI